MPDTDTAAHLAPSRALDRIFRPVDISPFVYFRIVFGLIILWEVFRYYDHGWIEKYYINPGFNFNYWGFEWVRPWPGVGMYLHYAVVGLLAIHVMLGFHYRVSSILLFLGLTFIFLLDQTQYLNHFYLICLVSFVLIFIPCHRDASLDARRRPEIRSATAPVWMLWILRIQIGIPYFFGGIAKLNSDWLVGEPMRMWLKGKVDYPLIGRFFTEEWFIYGISYSGLVLDLIAVPLLLWRRTRILAVVLVTAFHLSNARLFSIGIFPWFMIASTPLFFGIPWRGAFRIGRLIEVKVGSGKGEPLSPPRPPRARKLTAMFFVSYLAVQFLLPLRHHLYPGNVSWTEEGHKFSWHMKLRSKRGLTLLTAEDPRTGETWLVDSSIYLTDRQISKMAGRPDMILCHARNVGRLLAAEYGGPVRITCQALVSLNGRRHQAMVDPTVDLLTQTRSLAPWRWILPLSTPLEVRQDGRALLELRRSVQKRKPLPK